MTTFLRSGLLILGCAMFFHISSCIDLGFTADFLASCAQTENAPESDAEDGGASRFVREELLCDFPGASLNPALFANDLQPLSPDLSGLLGPHVTDLERPPRV